MEVLDTFKNGIVETPLSTTAANDFFGNITGDTRVLGDDATFVSTLRALLHNRIGKDGSIRFTYSMYNAQSSRIGRMTPAESMEQVFPGTGEMSDRIHLCNLGNYVPEENVKWFEHIEKHFLDLNPDWVRLDKITVFYQKMFKVLCYINPEIRGVQLFVVNLNHKWLHLLQCAISVILPWYFPNPKEDLSAEELELFNALKVKDSAQYEKCIEKIAERFDFRSARIRKLLNGFDTRADRALMGTLTREIEGIDSSIAEKERWILARLKEKDRKNTMLLGLMEKLADPNSHSEVTEYFLCNKALSLREVTDDYLEFVAMGYLTYFDEDAAKKAIKNKNSVLYSYISDGLTKDDIKMLLTAVFIDQTLRMKFCAAYRLYPIGDVEAVSGYNFGNECREYMPNPHINNYSCMGNYKQQVRKALGDHDYVTALQQCIASSMSLNFCDGTVMERFARQIGGNDRGPNVRCIELPDGRVVNPKDAIAWLKKSAEPAPEHTDAEV